MILNLIVRSVPANFNDNFNIALNKLNQNDGGVDKSTLMTFILKPQL
jgi:hypothetical protein